MAYGSGDEISIPEVLKSPVKMLVPTPDFFNTVRSNEGHEIRLAISLSVEKTMSDPHQSMYRKELAVLFKAFQLAGEEELFKSLLGTSANEICEQIQKIDLTNISFTKSIAS